MAGPSKVRALPVRQFCPRRQFPSTQQKRAALKLKMRLQLPSAKHKMGRSQTRLSGLPKELCDQIYDHLIEDYCRDRYTELELPSDKSTKCYPRWSCAVPVSRHQWESDFAKEEVPFSSWPECMLLVKGNERIADEIRERFCQIVELFRFEPFRLELQPNIPCETQEEGRYNYFEQAQFELIRVWQLPAAQKWLNRARFCKVVPTITDDCEWRDGKVSEDPFDQWEEQKDSGRYIKLAKLARMIRSSERIEKIDVELRFESSPRHIFPSDV